MITPMEIQNHEFSKSWQGFQRDEVRRFLHALAEEFERLLESNHDLGREVSLLRERVKDMESREKVLKDTLVSAQQIKAEIHENALKEAELIVKEGQLRAESFFEEAREAVSRMRDQIVELKRVRGDLLAESEIMVSRFNHFIEAEQLTAQQSDKLHNLLIHRRSPANEERDKRAEAAAKSQNSDVTPISRAQKTS